METLQIHHRGQYVVVQLDRGTANPINMTMVNELRLTFDRLREEPEIRGVILTGKEKFFSAGFDLIELYDYDEVQIKAFWTNFFALMVELVAFPKPMIAAVTGHSPAGGCVLGFCADYRIMADGQFKTGMNEIGVGIVVPYSLFHLYSYWIGNRKAYMFLTEGRLFKPREALEHQLVDEVVDASEVVSRAEEKIQEYLQFDSGAWQKSKIHLRQDLISQLRVDFDIAHKDTLDQWWSPKARTLLKSIVDHLLERKRLEEERQKKKESTEQNKSAASDKIRILRK
jgi:enoyl-CoA hydratase/carnithine racemase